MLGGRGVCLGRVPRPRGPGLWGYALLRLGSWDFVLESPIAVVGAIQARYLWSALACPNRCPATWSNEKKRCFFVSPPFSPRVPAFFGVFFVFFDFFLRMCHLFRHSLKSRIFTI